MRLLDVHRPVVLEVVGSGDIALPAWILTRRDWIEQRLHETGALLFRSFQIHTPKQLHEVAESLSGDFPSFAEESSPRHQIEGHVFSSTDYPNEYPIQMHSEYSYAAEWPMKLIFGCLQPAVAGGATPVASTHAVLRRLSASTRAAFGEHGVMYVRHYLPGLGVSWEEAFQSDHRSEVERRCASAGIHTEWLPGNGLRTRQVGSAIVRHPVTSQELWFNHAFFFNVHSLEPLELRELFLAEDEGELPTQTYFGNGRRIPEAMISELRAAYAAETVRFAWQRGDVLVIDNMLMAHGREPFEGPRNIAVVMTDRFRRADLC